MVVETPFSIKCLKFQCLQTIGVISDFRYFVSACALIFGFSANSLRFLRQRHTRFIIHNVLQLFDIVVFKCELGPRTWGREATRLANFCRGRRFGP